MSIANYEGKLTALALLAFLLLPGCNAIDSSDSARDSAEIPQNGIIPLIPGSTPTPTPDPSGLGPETHLVDGQPKTDPYRLTVNAQGDLYRHFADNIQPILQGSSASSTPTNTCTSCHSENRFNMVNFKICSGNYDADPSCIERNYWQFLGKGLVNYEKVEGSWVLGALRGYAGVDNGVPGIYHMDRNFVIGQGPVYQAFKSWIQLERQARTPRGIGDYASAPRFMCWLAREKADFDTFISGRGNGYLREDGAKPHIYCQRLTTNHNLTGAQFDISTMMQPALTDVVVDFENLVSNYAQDGTLKLYTALYKHNTWPTSAQYNSIEIAVTQTDGVITAANWRYLLNTEWQNSGSITARSDELGSIASRWAQDVPTDVLPGDLVVFQSDRGNPHWLNPPHPDPAHPTQQDPQIPLTTKVSFPDSYHQFFWSQQIYYADATGIPKMLIPEWGNHVKNATVAPDGKIYTEIWDNKYNDQTWIQQFVPDLRNGSADLNPPFLNKTQHPFLGHDQGRMAVDAMGNLMVEQSIPGIYVEMQIGRHDLGISLAVGADQAPSVQDFRDTGATTYSSCAVAPVIPGIDRRPLKASYGFYFVTSSAPFDACGAAISPANLGISWADHKNGNRTRVLNVPASSADFPAGYFVDAIAVLGERQVPPTFVPADEIQNERLATIHIPNVAGRLMTKSRGGYNMEAKFTELSTKITHVRVLRNKPNPYGTSQFSSTAWMARGGQLPNGNTHNSFGASEFINSAMLLGEIPVAADGSVAFTFPSGVGLFIQYLTTVNTSKGPLKVAVNQEGQILIPKPGYNELSAALNLADYRSDCMRCHGATGTYISVEDLTRNHGGTTPASRRNTTAMQNPVNLAANPIGRHVDYVTMVKPHLEAMQCTYCHGKQVDGSLLAPTALNHHDSFYPTNPNSAPGGLSFESDWHATANIPAWAPIPQIPDAPNGANDSVRWTRTYAVCTDGAAPPCLPGRTLTTPWAGQPMGARAPYEPGYVLLQKYPTTIPGDPWNERFLYIGQDTSSYIGHGVSTNDYMTNPIRCSLFLLSLGIDVECGATQPTYFDRLPFAQHLPAGWPVVNDPTALPLAYNHHAAASNAQLLEMAQDFERAVSNGWDYRLDFKEPAPSYSPSAGSTRLGLDFQVQN